MYTIGSFGPAGGHPYALLKDEDTSLSTKLFDRKSLPECVSWRYEVQSESITHKPLSPVLMQLLVTIFSQAALCDEWYVVIVLAHL